MARTLDKSLAGKRCILLGGGGFIGTNLCQRLVNIGADVIIVSPQVISEEALSGSTWIRATLDETDKYEATIRAGDYVFHMVSTTVPATSNANPIADISNNVLPTLKLLEILHKKQIAKLVFLSSGGTVYGKNVPIPTPEGAPTEPMCSYGIHKLTIEKYLSLYKLLHGLDSVVLRVANPFGPWQVGGAQGVVATIIRKSLRGETIVVWGDGSVVRDYIFVSDVIEAILRAAVLDNAEAPRLYNVGSGEGRSIQQILDSVQAIHRESLNVIFEAGRAMDVPVSILDIGQAEQYLNWKPQVEWGKSVAETYAWSARYNQLKPIRINRNQYV
jgi:UDP-glucose 4-epimerase